MHLVEILHRWKPVYHILPITWLLVAWLMTDWKRQDISSHVDNFQIRYKSTIYAVMCGHLKLHNENLIIAFGHAQLDLVYFATFWIKKHHLPIFGYGSSTAANTPWSCIAWNPNQSVPLHKPMMANGYSQRRKFSTCWIILNEYDYIFESSVISWNWGGAYSQDSSLLRAKILFIMHSHQHDCSRSHD